MSPHKIRAVAGCCQNPIMTHDRHSAPAGVKRLIRLICQGLKKIQPYINSGNSVKGVVHQDGSHQRCDPDNLIPNGIGVRINSALSFPLTGKEVIIAFAYPVLVLLLIFIIHKRFKSDVSVFIPAPIGNESARVIMPFNIGRDFVQIVQGVRLPIGIDTDKAFVSLQYHSENRIDLFPANAEVCFFIFGPGKHICQGAGGIQCNFQFDSDLK